MTEGVTTTAGEGRIGAEMSSEHLSSVGPDFASSDGAVAFSRIRGSAHLREPDSTTGAGGGGGFGGFQRSSTNDLRRSLRRINSITRRKLSPARNAASHSGGAGGASTPSASTSSSGAKKSGDGIARKGSYCEGLAEEKEEEEDGEEEAKVTDPLNPPA